MLLAGAAARAQFTSQHAVVYLPGNFNGYDTYGSGMQLISNGLWQGYVVVTNYSNPQFLFSNYPFDNPPASNALVWKESDQSQFGLPMSGTAEQNTGNDISITGTVSALLKFTFNDQTRGYTVQNVSPGGGTNLWINEFHYDDANALELEFVEIAGPAGSLSGYQLWLYNGADGRAYRTNTLSGSITNEQNGMGTVVVGYTNLLQNGSPDGFALVRNGSVVQFLSYEGTFAAIDGPASGMTSTAISPSEVNTTPTNYSIQLTGVANTYSNFTWVGPALASRGAINGGQVILGGAEAAVVTVTNLVTSPTLPLTGQPVVVTAHINASGSASNLSATLFYRVGTAGRFLPIAMTNSGNAFTTSPGIPAQAPGAYVYYYLFVNFAGAGTNSPTLYPAGGPAAPLRYGVGTVPAGTVWINELNPSPDFFSNDDYEFVELAGIAGSAIGSWTVQVFSVDAALVTSFTVPSTRVLPNDFSGFGFHVLGDTNGGLPNVDQAFPAFPDNILDEQGAVRVLDQFGNTRDYVYWRWPGNTNPPAYEGSPRYLGYEVDGVFGEDYIFALGGTGGTASAFTWRTNIDWSASSPTNRTPGAGNTNQYFTGGNTNPIPPLIICPADVVYGCVTSPPAANTASVTATGYCGSGSVTITWLSDTTNTGSGCKGSPRIVERKYRAVSTCASTSICSQFFIMEDTNAPVLIGPTQTLANAGFEFGSTVGWTEFGTTNDNLTANIEEPRSGFFHASMKAPFDLKAFDAASNEFDGVYVNGTTRGVAPATTAQVFAAEFDGVDDYVNVATPLSLYTNTMTITTWMRRNGSQPNYAGVVFGRSTSTVSGLGFTLTNQLGYHWNGATNSYGWLSGIVPPDTQWCFVALTISSSRAELYMRTTSSWSFAANNVSHGREEFEGALSIGRDPSAGRQYKGRLDDVQIYNRRLSSNEIVAIWNNGLGGVTATNPYARWMLNETYPGASARGLYQDLAASSGQYWNAAAWAQMNAADPLKGTNEVTLALQFLNVSNAVIATSNSPVKITSTSPTNRYVRMIARGTAPAGTTKARLRLQYQQDGAGNQGVVQVDDALLSPTVVVAGSGLGACGTLPNYMTNGLVTATDQCSTVTMTQIPAPGTTFTNANIPVTITARDACGNSSDVSFQVLVDDTNAPTIFTINPSSLTTNCYDGPPTSTTFVVIDNCNAGWFVEMTASTTNGGNGCPSNQLVVTNTYVLTDLGGNTVTKYQTITSSDTAVPSAVCIPPALSNGTFETGSFGTNWTTFGPNVQVLPTLPRSGTYHAKLAGETNGVTSYSGFYQDLPTEAGVTWRLGAWVTTPTNEVIGSGSYLEAKIEFLDGSETITDTYSARLFTNGIIAPGLYQQLHVTAIPYAGAAKARATILFVQANNEPGTVFIDDVSLSRNTYSATNMAYAGPYLLGTSILTGSLACAGSLADVTNIPVAVDCHVTSVTQIPPYGVGLALGTNTLRLPVRDECGNATTTTMNIVVFDVTRPVVLTGPSNITVATTNLIPPPNIAMVVATDDCSSIVVTNLPDQYNGGAGTSNNPLIVIRRYLVRDIHGNLANHDQIITVNGGSDVVAPTNVAVTAIALGTNITIRSSGTNTWSVLAEYATNLLGAQNWLQLTNANNVFSNGTNITTFVLPTNALPAYIRVKQVYP